MHQGIRGKLVLLLAASLLATPVCQAQEDEGAGSEVEASEGVRGRHAISLFAGAATHTERSETGGAIGLG